MNVSISPKATRTDGCISPCGGKYSPMVSSTHPNRHSVVASMSWSDFMHRGCLVGTTGSVVWLPVVCLEFCQFLCEHVTTQCGIFELVLELLLVSRSFVLVSECCGSVCGSRFEIALSLFLGFGEWFRPCVTTFDGVECVVASCEIGVRMFADFTG